MLHLIKKIVVALLEAFASPVVSLFKVLHESWEDQALVTVNYAGHTKALTVRKLKGILFTGINAGSILSCVKASLADGARLLGKDEMTTKPGGKVVSLTLEAGAFHPAVERKLLKVMGVDLETWARPQAPKKVLSESEQLVQKMLKSKEFSTKLLQLVEEFVEKETRPDHEEDYW